MTWDYPKKEDLGKRENIIKNIVSRKVIRAVGSCSKKPQILFWIYDRFLLLFWIFSTKHGILL